MRIDFQIPAHLRQQVSADFLLSILEGGELVAEIHSAVAALSLVSNKLAGNVLLPRQLAHPLEFRTLHCFMLGQFCPNVKRHRDGVPAAVVSQTARPVQDTARQLASSVCGLGVIRPGGRYEALPGPYRLGVAQASLLSPRQFVQWPWPLDLLLNSSESSCPEFPDILSRRSHAE
jgi:hypothetical protein